MVNPEQMICFYSKASGYKIVREFQPCQSPNNYCHLLEPSLSSFIFATTEHQVGIHDLQSSKNYQFENQHSKTITCVKTSQLDQNLVFTGSQDGQVIINDIRTLNCIAKLQLKHPIYSLTFNSKFIACGTNQDTVIWDFNNLKKPMIRLNQSHNQDVTGLEITEQGDMISCSIDSVLNMFKIQHNTSEDDMIDGAYRSIQPLIACGYVNEMVIWAQTSINTLELIRVDNATLITTVSKFPHDAKYIIKVQVIKGILEMQCGNEQGEIYIYKVNIDSHPTLELVDILLTQQPSTVRDTATINNLLVSCNENNQVQIWEYDQMAKQTSLLQAQAQLLMELE